MQRLRDVHLSSKWSVHPSHLLEALDYLVDQVLADRIRLTEVSPSGLRHPLAEWTRHRGWYICHPQGAGRNECAILSRFPLTAHASFQATQLRLKVGRTAPTFVVAARTRGWGWADVLHTPAHTGGLQPGLWTTRVYRSVMQWLGSHRVGKKRTASGDYNVDVRRPKWRLMLRNAYPGLKLCAPVDQQPTEGNRVIDAMLTDLDFEPSVTVRWPEKYRKWLDHFPVLTVLKQP